MTDIPAQSPPSSLEPVAARRADAPPGLVIRAAEPRDAGALTLLFNLPLYRAGTLRPPFQSEADTARWLASADAPGSLRIVAEEGGRLVGLAGLSRFAGRRQHVAALGMGVHDDHHRRGIGRALLAALLDAAFGWLQIRRIELTVFTDNAGAIALYERHGFEVEGLHRAFAFRDGAYADVLAMARLAPDAPITRAHSAP